MMGGRVRFYSLIITLGIGLPSTFLFAGGRQEDPIDLARRLIIERRHNEALLILTETARTDPERIEQVEYLIRRIRAIRGEYYDKYEMLIHVLYEKKDVEQALAIIRELEALDPTPNPSTRIALQKARESALFVFNQNRFIEVMTLAERALEQRDYAKAIEIYVSGFDIGKEFFLEANYGNIVETRVSSLLNALQLASERFIQQWNRFIPVYETLKAAIEGGGVEDVQRALEAYFREFQIAANLYKASAETTAELKAQNERLVLLGRVDQEDFHLGFLQRIIGGRTAALRPEGIRGAVELFFEERTFPIISTLTARINDVFKEGEGYYEQGQWDEASRAFTQVQAYRLVSQQIERILVEAIPLFESRPLRIYWDLVQDLFPLWLDQIVRTNGSIRYLSLIETYVSLRADLEALPPERANLEVLRASITSSRTRLEEEGKEWLQFSQEKAANPYLRRDNVEVLDGIEERFADRFTFWGGKEVEIVYRLASMDLSPLENTHAELLDGYGRARAWLEGIEEVVRLGDGQEGKLTVRYPHRTITLVRDLTPEAEALLRQITNYLAIYGKEIPQAVSDPRIRERLSVGESIRRSVETEMLPGFVSLQTRAQESIVLAERFRSEGNRRVQEVQAAIAQNQFDQARDGLSAARQRFTLSLSHREDSVFRTESDDLLLRLNSAITDAENRLVIAEVRRLINEARRLFFLNRFDESETLLLRAQTRWRATQAEDNPEISFWLGFVRSALFVKAAREFSPSDPLFVEMSQLLSLARKDFERGRSLLERGNRREALDAFAQAEVKIRTILIAFPFNQQASVLALRIAQLKDRDGFAALFRTKFREALAKVDTNPQEAYVDLQDLEQIDPNFAGLREAIVNLEYKIGIRIRPPDPRALAESEELFRAALRIVTGNIRAQFPIALEQLNRAIQLNPENSRAVELKDRVQIETGGQTSIVLSSVAEQQYRLAERRFIEGNYFEALSIVQRLLQDRASRNFPPLIELRRRIESRI